MHSVIGQRAELSFNDILILNNAYCSDECKGYENTCQHDGFLDPNDCDICICPSGFTGGQCEDIYSENSSVCGESSITLDIGESYDIVSPSMSELDQNLNLQCVWYIEVVLFDFFIV